MLPSYLTLIKSQWIPTKHYRFPWIQRWSNLYLDKDSGKSGLKLCLENDDSGASNSLSDLYSMQGTICYLRTDLWTNKQINKWRAKNKLHTNKKHMETFKTIPFTTALKKMKYLCRKCKKKKNGTDCIMEITKCRWKKSKTTQINGETYHVCELDDSM